MPRRQKSDIVNGDSRPEVYTKEGLFVRETWNRDDDTAVSIARCRVEPGATTRRHVLRGVDERYLVIEGHGRIEIGDRAPRDIGPGDLAFVPADVSQRVTNTGADDLIFYCVCTPRFEDAVYLDVDENVEMPSQNEE